MIFSFTLIYVRIIPSRIMYQEKCSFIPHFLFSLFSHMTMTRDLISIHNEDQIDSVEMQLTLVKIYTYAEIV